MVSSLVPGSSGPGSSPGRGHSVVFLGKTLHTTIKWLIPGLTQEVFKLKFQGHQCSKFGCFSKGILP